MTSPLMFFNLGVQEIIILAVLGLGGLGVVVALVVTLMLGSQRRPPDESDGSE